MTKARLGVRILGLAILLMALLQILRPNTSDASGGGEEQQLTVLDDNTGRVAQELEKRRKELDERERLLKEREEQLSAQGAEIEKRIQRIEEIRAEINGDLKKKRDQSEERITRMIAVFETMAPKSAAQVMETLDDDLSVEVLGRMDPKRVAKIMNIMDKSRSARLSEQLTGYLKPDYENSNKSGRTVASQSSSVTATEQSAGQSRSSSKDGGGAPSGDAGKAVKSEKGGSR
ncbi:MAG TPA: hypothetical protein PLH57_11800 [Oligoflexia bacterium]|nr:hypothetical protein [Oligoflexia bacterium]